MFYIYYEDGEIIGSGEAKMLSEKVLNIEVDKEVYDDFSQNPEKYTYNEGNIILNPEYDAIKQKDLLKKRMEEILSELDILDKKRIRAVCEDEIKDDKTNLTWLDYYNSQIYDLRLEYKSIKSQI